jgi:hypothetical protein
MVQKLPAGTRICEMDSIAVHSGDEVAIFSTASKIVRTADHLTLIDAESHQSFVFAGDATIDVTSGGSHSYVAPGRATPAWIARSNARLVGIQ